MVPRLSRQHPLKEPDMPQASTTPAQRVTLTIGLVLALILPSFGFAKVGTLIPGIPRQLGAELVFWLLAAAVVLYVLVVERRPLSSIGLKPMTWQSLIFAAAAWIATFVVLQAIVLFVFPLLHLSFNAKAMQRLIGLPYWVRFEVVLRAGICEELFFRGYGLSRLEELTGSKLVAGAVTLALFTYAHLAFWGLAQIFIAAGAGLVLTVLYLWRRDLGSNMLAHWLTDAAVVLTR